MTSPSSSPRRFYLLLGLLATAGAIALGVMVPVLFLVSGLSAGAAAMHLATRFFGRRPAPQGMVAGFVAALDQSGCCPPRRARAFRRRCWTNRARSTPQAPPRGLDARTQGRAKLPLPIRRHDRIDGMPAVQTPPCA